MADEIRNAQRTGKKRDEHFSMKIDSMLKMQAQRAAIEHGKTLSSFTEQALREFLQAHPLDDREPRVG